MTDKKPVPPSLAEFALEQLAEAGEQAAIDLTVQNVEILRAEIERREARIVELEVERNRLLNNPKDVFKKMCDMALKQRDEFAAELAALKAQQSSAGVVLPVVLPESIGMEERGEYGAAMARGFNACLREVARLNHCRTQAVPDGWRPVPRLATNHMIAEGQKQITAGGYANDVYRAMLAAAPSAQQKESE